MKCTRLFIIMLLCFVATTKPSDFDNIFEMEDPHYLEFEDVTNSLSAETRAITPPNEILQLLTDPTFIVPINAQELLKDSIYSYSFPPIRRDIIDEPMFQQFTERAIEQNTFTFKPFATQTFKEYFYGTDTDINNYIDLDQQPAKNLLSDITNTFDIDLPYGFDIDRILNLFSTAFLEERRVGMMFEYIKDTTNWSLSGRVPFYYGEHNLNIPLEQREEIEIDPFLVSLRDPMLSLKERQKLEVEFARKNLISDRLGFGDTRINFEYVLADRRMLLFSLGARVTLPTSFAVKKGLYGSHFSDNAPTPTVDLYTDFLAPALNTPPDQNLPLLYKNAAILATEILHRLSTIVLETSLGNFHHLGLGIFTHNKMKFTPQWSLSTLNQFEILLPAHENRFYIIKTPQAAIDAFDWEDTGPITGNIAAKYAFLDQEFTNKFFPECYDTTVFPGFILQNTSALRYLGRRLEVTLGTDMWWHSKEWLMHIEAPASQLALINKKTATKRFAYQSMVWGSFEKRPHPDSSWKIGLRAEVTLNSFGVGDEWGATILFQKQF